MIYSAEVPSSLIVVNVDFNPAIFSPDWLEANNIIGADDADAAEL